MTLEERHALVTKYLHTEIDVEIERPIGYVHHKNSQTIVYPINYGYINGVLGGDGEFLDVYIVGVNEPISSFHGKVIGIVYRRDDVEDKLIACPLDMTFSKEEIEKAISFRESFYDSYVEI